MNEGTHTCADCGRPIVFRTVPEGWVNEEDDSQWSYVCRITYRRDGDHFKVESCDYHYIEGGTQKHYRGPDA